MRILLLSPHTDDVELGAGGLVSRLAEEGSHAFKWLVFSRCEGDGRDGSSRDQGCSRGCHGVRCACERGAEEPVSRNFTIDHKRFIRFMRRAR